MSSVTTTSKTRQHCPRFARIGRLEVMAERLSSWHRPSILSTGRGDLLAWIGPWHFAASILPRPSNRAESNSP
jgi:hypothetical protein